MLNRLNAALTDTMALSMPQAYQVQAAVTRRQAGVAEMNFGPLTDVMAARQLCGLACCGEHRN